MAWPDALSCSTEGTGCEVDHSSGPRGTH